MQHVGTMHPQLIVRVWGWFARYYCCPCTSCSECDGLACCDPLSNPNGQAIYKVLHFDHYIKGQAIYKVLHFEYNDRKFRKRK